jgi:hypothetical protein
MSGAFKRLGINNRKEKSGGPSQHPDVALSKIKIAPMPAGEGDGR